MGRIDQWRRGEILGRGATATVSIANSCDSGEVFAVKSAQMACAEVLKREESILSSLNSPFIISYLGSDISRDPSTNQSCYNLFMEYAQGGSLSDKIKNQDDRLTESFIRSRTYEILSGLVYLHANHIAHCDIKCQNILIGSDEFAKIADFGCSKDEFSKEEDFRIRGTPMYMAPEVARGEEQGTLADVWALGCVVIEMITGAAPWQGFSDPVSLLHHIGNSSNVPKFPNWISEQGKDFLSKCLNRDPKERWTAEKLLNHPFVSKSENWVDEETRETPKSILEQEIWESLTLEIMPTEPLERIGALATGESSMPNWNDSENWIAVRGKSDDRIFTDIPSSSGDHMETEEFQFITHGLDFECCNKYGLEGVNCNNDLPFCFSSSCRSDECNELLRRHKELYIRLLIGYFCFAYLINFYSKLLKI